MVLPQPMRLKGHRCFNHLHRNGNKYHCSSMVISIAKERPHLLNHRPIKLKIQPCRCAVAISTKVSKSAVKRNRLRRQFHDHLKQKFYSNPNECKYWILINLKPISIDMGIRSLLEECDLILTKAGLIR